MTKDEMNEQLLQQVKFLTSTIEAQTKLIAQLNQTIQELNEKLNKNSKNSSKPPSSDEFKKPAPKSLRKPSGKKVGGQDGHQGTHLEVIVEPHGIVKICQQSVLVVLITRCVKGQPVLQKSAMSLMLWLQ